RQSANASWMRSAACWIATRSGVDIEAPSCHSAITSAPMASRAKRPAPPAARGFEVTVKERVARLTLRRPPLNILDIATCLGLAAALRGLARRPDVGALVLSAEGRSFSAGVDIGEHLPPN